MTKHLLTSLLFLLVFSSLFAPTVSFASQSGGSFIHSGNPCYSNGTGILNGDIMDFEDPRVTVTCPWCVMKGTRWLLLSWNLIGETYDDPVCIVSCYRNDSGSCDGALYWDSSSVTGGAKIARNTFPPDDNGNGNSIDEMNIQPDDGAYFLGVEPGNRYKVMCCEQCPVDRKPGDCEGLCKKNSDDTVKRSESYVVEVKADCRIACEKSLDNDISPMLFNTTTTDRPVSITERDFNDWIDDTIGDDNSFKYGSGDKGDIDQLISSIGDSRCSGYSSCPLPEYSSNKATLEKMKIYTDKKFPIHMIVSTPNIIDGEQNSVIVTSVNKTNDKYIVDFIDPLDEQQFSKFECATYFGGDYRCISPSGRFSREPFVDYDGFLLGLYRDSKIDSWISSRDTFCKSALYKDKDNCRLDVKDRLGMLSIPTLDNVYDSKADSFGLVEFVLRVVYLGDFVGHDYHPDDGKYVGEDCDANHYPFAQKANRISTPGSWFNNIFNVFKNFKLR